MTSFAVYLHDGLIGSLVAERGRLSFRYTDEAVANPGVHPISIHLHKRQDAFSEGDTRGYFENLLPESQFRRLVANALALSPENTAGLLGAIGGECVGAVSVWPEREMPEKEPRYRAVDLDWLRGVFAVNNVAALAEAQEEARLSLPGVEEKLALRITGEASWHLPLGGAPGTHVVKRPRAEYPDIVQNEHFCTALARAAGIGAVETSVVELGGGKQLLASRRFDRSEVGGRIVRTHQEDFCQALGVAPSQKYESEGGPSFARIGAALREHSAVPIADIARLVRWAAFNYVVGNEDAHGKNIALEYDAEGRVRLAPFYDLVCTEVYKGLKRKGAMRVGGEYRHRMIGRAHWIALGVELGLRERALLRQVIETAEAVRDTIDEVDTGESGIVSRVRELAIHRSAILIGHRSASAPGVNLKPGASARE